MKTAIYIDEGTTQLVLTPENEWEKTICKTVAEGEQQVKIMHGEFYGCAGGWFRHTDTPQSLILRVNIKAKDGSASDEPTGQAVAR